jgi:hypothetical protein
LIGIAAILSQAAPQAALADTVAAPGTLTISRDVPTRYAYMPGEPGEVTTIPTGPSKEVFEILGAGLTPLTDEQAAGVTGDPGNSHSGATPNGVGSLESVLVTTNINSVGAPGMTSTGGIISGAIAQGTNAIVSGVSALGTALGSLGNQGQGQ